MSHHRNPRVAGQEAARAALEAAGVDRPDFSFAFATVGYDQRALLQGVREATGHAPLCGCSGEGVIARGEADESNFSVGVMAVRSDELRFNHGIVTGLGGDPAQTGRAIAEAVRPELTADTLALFAFPDGLTVNFDRMVMGLEGELGLDRPLPLLGGTAGNSLDGSKPTCQYHDDRVLSDGVAWALLSGHARIAWAISHGCVLVGATEHTVTRCEGNVLYEIDGKPPLAVARDYLPSEVLDDWLRLGTSFLAIRTSGHTEGDDEYLIRAMVGRDDATGSVIIPTEISEGASVRLMRRDYGKMAAGVEQMVDEIQAQLGDKPARLAFQFDCMARGKVFLREGQKLQLLEMLQGGIGPDVPWLGFYTLGEIGPVGGRNCFHNHTVILAVIYD
jgi:hypothetical protein